MKAGLASAAALPMVEVLGSPAPAQAAQAKAEATFAAVPGEKGVQDVFGAYDVDPNWPHSLSDLPGNEQWNWGSGEGVFAENPDRVFILQRGMLPNIKRPNKSTSRNWGRASRSPLAACRGATPPPPARQGSSTVPITEPKTWTGSGATASSR